ncbi:hypothetical protein AC249_AIPGENE4622 [Exaiptasia diaphana]|nr:hypothetical protein AC249_AIPGENE4622 [Exaiptasia diaphana]
MQSGKFPPISLDSDPCLNARPEKLVHQRKRRKNLVIFEDKFNWTSTPTSSLTILYGQNLTLTWNVDLSPSITFQSATVWQTKGNNRNPVISYYVNGSKSIFGQTFQNRTADLALTAIQSGSIVSIRFEYAYLIKSTDEGAYDASVTAASEITDVSPNKTNVTINDREIWMTYPPSLTRIQGQSMTLIWKGNFPYQKFLFAKVWISKNGNKEDVAFYKAENGTAEARGSYINRSAHISLTVSQIRSVVIVTFVLENLLKNTDEGAFDLTLTLSDNTITAPKTPLMINVIKKVVKSTFKCNSCTYESGLGDHRSIVFNTLKEKIEKMLRLVYAVHKYVKSVDVSAFWPGSVIVEFKLTLIANVSDPLSPFKAAVCKQGGSLEGINIDLNSIQEGTYILPTTTISTTVETAIETTASTGTYILPTTTISTTVETAIETTASTENSRHAKKR